MTATAMVTFVLIAIAAALSAVLIIALRPVLVRYALARPNARSSHKVPTPQGGGIAVLAAALLTGAGGLLVLGMGPRMDTGELTTVVGAALLLAGLGAWDDIRPLPASFRLIVQAFAVALVVFVAETEMRLFPAWTPLWLEQVLLVVGGVWLVNLVNFMDGIDWITVAEFVPLFAFLTMWTSLEPTTGAVAIASACLLGALLGFAPFNKPVARLFLGDVGALPLGLLAGWMLLKLAATGAVAAALLLPLYYLADATLTLLRRLVRGERVWEAHREHFYQHAIDRSGFSVREVVASVFLLNLALVVLAALTLVWPSWPVQVAGLAAGAALVALVLRRFASPRSRKAFA
jgi:UDP-N-acetylmuramyl pentapeptide phosphotransferase/UDP-N-acetylglucosamine-1-phosphate transferase